MKNIAMQIDVLMFHFYFQEELLDTYRAAVFNQIMPKLNKLFNYMPKSELV